MLGEGLSGKFIWGNLLLYLSMITENFVPDIEKVFPIGNLEKILCLLSHEGPILTAFFKSSTLPCTVCKSGRSRSIKYLKPRERLECCCSSSFQRAKPVCVNFLNSSIKTNPTFLDERIFLWCLRGRPGWQ